MTGSDSLDTSMSKLIWVDLETTGLDPVNDSILEIAIAESDMANPFELRHIFQRVYSSAVDFESMKPFVQKMHTDNGLWAEVQTAEFGAWTAKAEDELMDAVSFVEEYGDRPFLAGSSVHFDRSFMEEAWPCFAPTSFHHRHFDVSSIKLFCQSLGMPKFPKNEAAHRAKADIIESAAHAKACYEWLVQNGFSPPSVR